MTWYIRIALCVNVVKVLEKRSKNATGQEVSFQGFRIDL